jgi:hypothetical protein
MNPTSRRLLFLIAAGALVFASCGGDEAATVVSSADGSETESTDAAGSSDAADSEAATDTADAAASSGEGSVEGDANSEYCRAVRGEIELPGDMNVLGGMDFKDPEAVQEMLDDADANLSQAVSIAPESLRADFQLVLESSMSMVSELAENGGDYSNIDASEFDNPEFEAAAERVDRYNVEVCGYDVTTATMPAAVGAETPAAMIEALLEPLQAELDLTDDQVTCLSEKMAASMEGGGAPDMLGMMEYFSDCDIDPSAG